MRIGDDDLLRRAFPRAWFQLKSWKYRHVAKGEPEIALVRDFVVPGTTAVDVGMSFGYYSAEMARYASCVLAFEPNPDIAAFGQRVLPSNVVIHQLALSSHRGAAELRIPLNGKGRHTSELATIATSNDLKGRTCATFTVKTERLDIFNVSPCSFIKIDVEGHEELVIEGGWGIIQRDLPTLMIEFDDTYNNGGFLRVRDRLVAIGYQSYSLSPGGLEHTDHADGGNIIFLRD
jgi:FkbM family methyltransferase